MFFKKLSLLFSSPNRLKIVPDILLVNMSVFTITAILKNDNNGFPFMECSLAIQGTTIGTIFFYLFFRIIILVLNLLKCLKCRGGKA